jgi:capsular polysaccharide biosynthesis protein
MKWPFARIAALTGKIFRRELPVNVLPEHVKFFRMNETYNCPNLYLYQFRSITLLPDATLILGGLWPLSFSFLFYRKRIKVHNVKGVLAIRRKWKKHTLPNAPAGYFTIHDAWTTNYYHWTTQSLPRLLLVRKLNSRATLLLPEDHCKPFHIEMLRMLGVENWITIPAGKNYFHVSNLTYPSHDIQIGDYHDDLIRELSSLLRSKAGNHNEKGNRLFIERSGHVRNIVNKEEVHRVLNDYGFDIVTFDKLGMHEQISLAANASIVVSVHGAGLTNMLFMDPGSRVMELTSQMDGEQYYYFTLSNALGHHYYYQYCKPDNIQKTIQEANILVDIHQLANNLELLTQGSK